MSRSFRNSRSDQRRVFRPRRRRQFALLIRQLVVVVLMLAAGSGCWVRGAGVGAAGGELAAGKQQAARSKGKQQEASR